MSKVDDAISHLTQHRATMRCAELVDLLRELGFVVRDGKRGGHKVFTHPALRGFHGSSFNCGHRQTSEVLPAYVSNMVRVIKLYEADLRKHLGESQ